MPRNPVACTSCRTAKRQCIHSDGKPPCRRCRDRAEECYFPPPGTSALHRGGRVRQSSEEQLSSKTGANIRRDVIERARSRLTDQHPLPSASSNETSRQSFAAGSVLESAATDVSQLDPYKLFTDEVKNSYLRCSYKWSFHHIPTLLLDVRQGTLDAGMFWAILALAIRFTTDAPKPFPTPISASNAFAAHARSLLLPGISSPTLSKIQGLLMVTGHSWGAGEARQAWIYLGVAVRMAQVVDLFEEGAEDGGLEVSPEEFIRAEERRRTAWTCFLMDSLLSGGDHRRRSLSVNDMRIPLPCDLDPFHFGEPVRVPWIIDITPSTPKPVTEGLGIVAHSMLGADTWGAVANWACSSAVESENPWELTSQFQNLLARLQTWRRGLPRRLEFGMESLRAHSAANQGQAWCYMHSIYFMSMMFLHRAYLSPSTGRPDRLRETSLSKEEAHRWAAWRAYSRKELLRVTEDVCSMYAEMRDFGLFFLRGLVPWIGFTVYTAVGIMLYFYHFPNLEERSSPDDSQHSQEPNEELITRARESVIAGCAFLKDMRYSWPMADSWRETIKRMQIFYANIKTRGEQGVSPMERSHMRDAIVDYGALHHTPVSEQTAPSPRVVTTPRGTTLSVAASPVESNVRNGERTQTSSANPPAYDGSPPDAEYPMPDPSPRLERLLNPLSHPSSPPAPTSSTSFLPTPLPALDMLPPQAAISPAGEPISTLQSTSAWDDMSFPDIDLSLFDASFDTSFPISSSDIQAAVYNSTQDFWISFPGETEMY